MKKITNLLYSFRIFMFIVHLLMIFTVLENIIDVGLIGYLFLIIDSIFVLRILFEVLTKKDYFKNEIYYNIMQIGLFGYISILWSKLYFGNMFFTKELLTYLQTNYIILIVLIIFLIFYSRFAISNRCKK